MSKKFFREDIEAPERRFRIAQNSSGDEGKESNQGDRAKDSKVGNSYGEISAPIPAESFCCF
ncbi:unnamed protein product [marine sediment metagenome]|uniref:Uncharacterized protein n=1 Tax=marine sediment metagenome TaxID=412755 RepID=X1JAE5_9ZZZZ